MQRRPKAILKPAPHGDDGIPLQIVLIILSPRNSREVFVYLPSIYGIKVLAVTRMQYFAGGSKAGEKT